LEALRRGLAPRTIDRPARWLRARCADYGRAIDGNSLTGSLTGRCAWIAFVAGFGLTGVPVSDAAASTARPLAARVVVNVRPAVVRLGRSAVVEVRTREPWRQLELRLKGSTTEIGLLSPWIRLRLRDGVWSARIPPLEARGVYPIELRASPGESVLHSKGWLYMVLSAGTLAGPSFPTPEGVVRAWIRRHGTLRALRRWPFSVHDRRVPALHQRLIVAYTPRGNQNASDRLGIFITAVRIGFGARWRLLEATVRP